MDGNFRGNDNWDTDSQMWSWHFFTFLFFGTITHTRTAFSIIFLTHYFVKKRPYTPWLSSKVFTFDHSLDHRSSFRFLQQLSLLCKNTNKWLPTTTNISQHLHFFVVWLTEYWSWSLTIILRARLAYNFSSFTAAVGQTHFFSIWQTIAREYVQGSLFHFPLPLPLTYKCPQFSNPTRLGSLVFHAEKVSATAVPSSHSKTLSPLGAIIPSRGSPFRSIRLKRKAFSSADLIIGRVAPSCLHR